MEIERLREERKELLDKQNEKSSTLHRMNDDIRQILRNTKQLVDSDNSILRRLEPLIASGVGAFFGSKMGSENVQKKIAEKDKVE